MLVYTVLYEQIKNKIYPVSDTIIPRLIGIVASTVVAIPKNKDDPTSFPLLSRKDSKMHDAPLLVYHWRKSEVPDASTYYVIHGLT